MPFKFPSLPGTGDTQGFKGLGGLKNLAPYQRNRLLAAVGGGFLLIFIIIGLVVFRKENTTSSLCRPVTITFWDVLDKEDVYQPLVNAYRQKNPCVTIEYKNKHREVSGESFGETYRKELTDALAGSEGPDIYLIHNSWLPMEQKRLVSLTDAYKNSFSSVSPFSEDVITPQTSIPTDPSLIPNPSVIISQYPDVVRHDFTRDGPDAQLQVYALPLSIDTLALYYNADYFNSHNYLVPPTTWEDFIQYVNTIRRKDAGGNILLAGAAFGASDTHGVIKGGDNINAAADIITLLMLQGGAEMNEAETGQIAFDRGVKVNGEIFYPSRNAFQFYTSFANPKSENYTWDPNGIFSIDAFSNGTAGMMVTYAHNRATIREKNPHLNFGVAPLPQPKDRFDKVNYANYWGFAVAERSKNPDIAWDFIQFITQKEQALEYLKLTDRPPALKELIPEFKDKPELSVFANQILTAKSWLRGEPFEAERNLQEAIKETLLGEQQIGTIISNVVNKINLLGNPLQRF